ncbi:MAG TPA: hypothetical protein VNH11_27680 [Pirellulales bacterium]|nr:hypothetical protein [Pirellulales bacterium]
MACDENEPRFAIAVGRMPELVTIASELFLGQITVDTGEDPEIDDKRYVVVHVETQQPIEEVAKRRGQWYHLTHRLLGRECELVCLAITVV